MNLKVDLKNKKIKVFLIVFALLISIPLSVFGYFEYNYQTGIKLAKEESWESAKVNLSRVQNYRDAEVILGYIDVRVTLNGKDNDPDTYYELIKSERNKLPEVYSGDLSDEITSYRVMLYGMMQFGEKTIEIKENIKEAIEFIKKGDYSNATMKLVFDINQDSTAQILYDYAQARIHEKNGKHDMMVFYLNSIPDDYTGEFSSEIKSMKSKYKNVVVEDPTPKPITYPPSIGMTAEQVRKSSWGNPKYINKTTTRYGVHEQWVYPDYRYVYLENGVVTAIQE